ncbi:MAG: hypothetical protein QOF18_2677 [Frankiaceae bacterium]|jgi:hypothetical protein|nr:hypothetical protein [Frankiaceae bacterium]
MSEELETRLREAMASRAEYGMTHTDTDRELHRLQHNLRRERGRRRMRIVMAAAAAAAVVGGSIALAVSLVGGGHDTNTVVVSPTPHASASTTPPPVTTVPAGFPVGTWAKIHQQFHETLSFSDVPAVTLHDDRGQSQEHLTLPAADLMTFDAGDKAFCVTSGTYRYAITKHQLHFTLVGKDSCQSRVSYLTGSGWKFTG